MKIIGNGMLLARDDINTWYDCGAVAFDDGKIIEIGFSAEILAKYPDAEFIDAGGGLIMPGMINVHEHIYSALARGFSINGYNPKGFLDVLDGMWWNIDRHLTLSQTRASAMATYLDCVKNGVTTVFDHHASYGEISGSLFEIASAAQEFGIRSCLCYEVSDRNGEDKMKAAAIENENFINFAQNDSTDMLRGMFGMHAQFTLSDKTMAYCRAHTPEGVGYHIHVAEGIEDLHACLRDHGKRIVDRLMDEGILGSKSLAAHCIYVDQREMELLRETDTMVVHNPESNMGNACGCPPTMEIMHHGVLTGLGTDGYTQDMIESYKVANILHKHHLCDTNAAWAEVPQMLFYNNAHIAGRYFKTPVGILTPGAAADIIVMDYSPRTPISAANCNGHILFGMNGRTAKTTVCNGEVLMLDRKLTKVDEEAVTAHTREEAAALWKSING